MALMMQRKRENFLNTDKESGKEKKHPGKVFGLFQKTETVQEVADCLISKIPKFKKHVFNSYSQWNAHSISRENLDEKSVITIEDYQQNMEVEYNENPTSMAYSSNKTSVALFPICVEYTVDGMLKKGGIVFISDDKKHDMQQVHAFEKRMFEIIRQNVPHPINHW